MEKKLYPLTQSQNLMFFEMDLMPFKQIVNICMEFEFKSQINQNIMAQAINLAMMRNPNNYIRLVKDGKEIKQYFTEDSLDKIEYIEYTDENEYQKSLKKFNGQPFPNKHIETQLFRIRFVKKPNGLYAINGCFSHVIYDAYSIMMTFKDICDCYKSLSNSEPIKESSISPIKAYESDYAYMESDRRAADKEFFENVQFASEPQYTVINGKNDKSVLKNKRYGKLTFNLKLNGGMLNIPIDRQLSDDIEKYASDNGMTGESIYMLAMRTFLSNVCETNDITINNVIGRRNTVVQKKAGGSMADGVYVRFTFDNDKTYNEALKETYKEILESYKHANYGAEATLDILHGKFNAPKMYVYNSMLLTYQPALYKEDDLEYSFLRLPNGKEISNVYLSVMPCDSNNNYVANYAFQSDFVSEDKIKEFHDFIMKFIRLGIDNDNLTLNELIERAGK